MIKDKFDVCKQSICGNGKLDGYEVCDDKNIKSGDGCSGDCSMIEDKFYCPTVG
jgi:cysteine-rich repeat protein